MIKGILALFKSGIIFNPMVFLGIIAGFVAMGTLDGEKLHAFYSNYHLYLLMLLIAALYVGFFKRTHFPHSIRIDWKATSLTALGHFLMLVISFIFSMLFIMVISFGSDEETEASYNLPEFEKIQQDVQKNQEELQKNYEAIMNSFDVPQN